MPDLSVTIFGQPTPQKRPRFARRGKFVVTYSDQHAEADDFKDCLKSQARNHTRIPAGTPVTLRVVFYVRYPKGTPAKKMFTGIEPTKKPDLDNYIKFILDCSNGILWHDDSQVIAITAEKHYDVNPKTKIIISW
jgi:Holliday junction resolvase RusA-like endonuclease